VILTLLLTTTTTTTTTTTQVQPIRGGVIALSIFDLMTLNIVLRVALGSVIMSPSLTFAWIIALFDADTLRHLVTLTFDPSTLKVCGTSSVT